MYKKIVMLFVVFPMIAVCAQRRSMPAWQIDSYHEGMRAKGHTLNSCDQATWIKLMEKNSRSSLSLAKLHKHITLSGLEQNGQVKPRFRQEITEGRLSRL